jgi:hypothetical protein
MRGTRYDPQAICARCRHFTRSGVAPALATQVDGRCLGFNPLIDDYKAWDDQCGMFDQARSGVQEREDYITTMEATEDAGNQTAVDQAP